MKRNPVTQDPDFWHHAREYLHTFMPKVRGLSPRTIEAYRISLECYLDYLTAHQQIERACVTFEHFDRHHLKAWLAWMNEQRQYSPKTIALRLSTIKAFLAYASHEEITLMVLSEAARALKAPAAPRKPIEYLTQDEMRAILSAFTGRTSKSRRNRMLLILLYDTAARVSEITSLTLEQLTLSNPGHVTLTGKRNKSRTVPLTSKTIEHLRVYLSEFHPNHTKQTAARPLFYSLHRGRPTSLSTDTIAAVLKQAAQTARDDCSSIPQRVHCHMLRKTKAMDLYQQGIPLPIIMRLLGHESTTTTTTFYAFATLNMMRDAINAATPNLNAPAVDPLTEHELQALYSLR